MIELISFDLDGTLVDAAYPNQVWLNSLPHLYAEQYDLPYEEARRYVLSEYDKIGQQRVEWYDIEYWFKKFALQSDWHDLLDAERHHIRAYPDALFTLQKLLHMGHELIIISNAKREFIDIQLDETGLTDYFSQIYSCTSDFAAVKKVKEFYSMICGKLKVNPSLMIHVGDHFEFDYTVPRQLGIHAYYLDRQANVSNRHTVATLTDFLDFIGPML